MKKYISIIIAILVSSSIAEAWSWKEHRLMAYIAEEHLTENTKNVLRRYLDQSIIEYANWMDRYRDAPGYKETTHWHMVTVSEDLKSLPEGYLGHAAQALRNAVDILEDYQHHNDSTVFVNILYVIHLVPETHCPSHFYFLDLGGIEGSGIRNFGRVKINDRQMTYHAIWDTAISTLYPGLDLDQYRKLFDTFTDMEQKSASEGSVEDWILENGRRIREIYEWAKPGDMLPGDFLEQHRELPESMVPRASYRLARLLNQLFDKDCK